MEMNIDTFAYDVLEGLNDGEVCFIISPSYKNEQLERVKELSTIPFRVIMVGYDDGYMLDPSKCGVVNKENELIYKGSYQQCCRYVDNTLGAEKVILLEPEYTHYCFKEYPVETSWKG